MIVGGLDDPHLADAIGPTAWQDLRDAAELLDGAGASFDRRQFEYGRVIPVFFGSAVNNFGVEPFLRAVIDLAPPPFPAERIDRAKADRGRPLYESTCARCHAIGGAAVGQVTPLAEIGTDAERLQSFTAALVERMNTIGTGRPWKFSHFRKTDGYANMPLDGVWLRAPYLHNGSVPTLRALLFPEERPAVFYRGYDVYDWTGVGFITDGPDAQHDGVKFDTRLRGNSNAGHVYGRQLSVADREALIEFLKTL